MTYEENNKPKGAFVPSGQEPQQSAGNEPQQTAGSAEPVKGTLAHATQTPSAPEPVKGTIEHATQKPAPAAEPIKGTLEHANQPTPLPTPTVQPQQIKPTEVPLADDSADVPTRTTAFDESIKQIQAEIDRRKPETEEERKKRERTERSKKVIGAVSDGLRALSNVFFTAKGAPSMYDPNASQLAQVEKKAKEGEAKRDAKDKERLAMLERLGNMKLARDKFNMTAEELKQRMKLANEKAQREVIEHGWLEALQPDKQRKAKGEADTAEAKAVTEQTNAKYADDMNKAKIENEKKRGQVYTSQIGKNNAQAAAATKNAQGEFPVEDENGNTHWFRTKDAAIWFGEPRGTINHTTDKQSESETTVSPDYGGKTKTTTVTKTRETAGPSYPKITPKPKKPTKQVEKPKSSYTNTKGLGY